MVINYPYLPDTHSTDSKSATFCILVRMWAVMSKNVIVIDTLVWKVSQILHMKLMIYEVGRMERPDYGTRTKKNPQIS